MNNVIERKWCTKGTVYIEDLTGTAFTGEDGGHTFIISGVNPDGTSITLAGTVAGAYILPDSSTQPLTGSIVDGKAQITLDPECYALPGRGQLTIFLTAGGQKVAIYGAVLNVARSSTDQVPPAITADVADLVNDIEEARATIPASYTDLMASLAKNYADLTYPVAAGTYAWQDGWMYRAKVDIPSAESWTASHWEKVPLADSLVDELSALKSAIAENANWLAITWVDGKYVSRTGGLADYEGLSYAEISLIGIKKVRFTLNSTNGNVSYCTKTAAGVTVASGFVHTPICEWVEHTVTATEAKIRITSDTNLKSEFLFYFLPDYSREEIDAVKKGLSDVKHNANWPTITWTDGKYVSKQGGLAEQSGYSYCDISLAGIKKIRFSLNSISSNVSYCTKNAASQTVYYGYTHSPTYEWVEHTVTDGEAFIRITSDTNLKSDFLCYFLSDYDRAEVDSLTQRISNLETTASQLTAESYMDVKASDILWSAGRYDASNGLEYSSAATFRITINGSVANYVTYCLRSSIVPTNALYIKAKGTNDYFYLSAWDASNNYIGVYDLASNTFKTSYDNNRITSVQQELRMDALRTAYPTYTWKVTVGDITNSTTALNPANVDSYIYFSVSSIEYLNEKLTIVKDGGFCRIFRKFGCIGDSLSSGAFEYKEDGTNKIDFIYDFSWPQYLARICDNSAINFSTGGLTTRTWLESEYCTQMMSGGDNLCDCYIIALGVNDLKTDDRHVDVGTVSDIDLSDYAQNVDTYCGNLGGIIQRIKSVQPRAKIFVLTNPGRTQAERAAAVPYNTAIFAVCELFTDCYVADLYSLGLFDPRYMLASHYGSNGYLKATWDISSLISAIIEDNPAEFKEVAFIGTNKTWG